MTPLEFDAARHMASGGDRCPGCGLVGRGFMNFHRVEHELVDNKVGWLLIPTQCDACRVTYVQIWRLDGVYETRAQALAAIRPEPPMSVVGFKSVDEFTEHLKKQEDAPEQAQEYDDYGDSEDPEDWIAVLTDVPT